MADLLNGVPSIVIGIFAWTSWWFPCIGFSDVGRGLCSEPDDDSHHPCAARSSFCARAAVASRRRSGAWAPEMEDDCYSRRPGGACEGLLTGTILGLARIAGETAPLLFTSLNNQFWSPGWNQPTASLPVMIFTHAIAPYDDWHRQAWAAGLVLLALVLIATSARPAGSLARNLCPKRLSLALRMPIPEPARLREPTEPPRPPASETESQQPDEAVRRSTSISTTALSRLCTESAWRSPRRRSRL